MANYSSYSNIRSDSILDLIEDADIKDYVFSDLSCSQVIDLVRGYFSEEDILECLDIDTVVDFSEDIINKKEQ